MWSKVGLLFHKYSVFVKLFIHLKYSQKIEFCYVIKVAVIVCHRFRCGHDQATASRVNGAVCIAVYMVVLSLAPGTDAGRWDGRRQTRLTQQFRRFLFVPVLLLVTTWWARAQTATPVASVTLSFFFILHSTVLEPNLHLQDKCYKLKD